MYAQAIRKPPVPRRGRANNQVRLNMFKGCAFSDVGLDCIKYLKLGDPACGTGGMLIETIHHIKNVTSAYGKIYGQENNLATSSIARMNLFLHRENDLHIKQGRIPSGARVHD